ncbi:hypothetical protein TIFTF001_011407 [Ficus carica]|uniref:Uncharacterized protein n=1 Tax=Ficus carica TaxID=3494 RepID=A0AA88DHV8_FICCA|nr:hypothetical protein TIFTF001_011407 [Ficus carica]
MPREEDKDLELGTGLPKLGVVGCCSTRAIAGHRTTKPEKKPHADRRSIASHHSTANLRGLRKSISSLPFFPVGCMEGTKQIQKFSKKKINK